MNRSYIIPIFLPYLGCRNRCIFCNQKAISREVPSPESVRKIVESSLATFPSKNISIQIAFYGASFTAMPMEDQISYLEIAREFILRDEIESIRISTRPDAIDEEILYLLKGYNVKTVEIGAQSMDDEVLLLSLRGHKKDDTISSIKRLKAFGYEVGVQLMIGLPGDTLERFLKTLDLIIDLRPDFLRIHPTLVLKGSPLEALWIAKKYSPLSLEDSIEWLKEGLLKLENASIPVARIGLQPTRDLEAHLIAGPYHPSIHQLVESSIFFDMAERLITRNFLSSKAVFLCNPKDLSNLKGQKNENIKKMKEKFSLEEIVIQTWDGIKKGSLALKIDSEIILIERKDLSPYSTT